MRVWFSRRPTTLFSKRTENASCLAFAVVDVEDKAAPYDVAACTHRMLLFYKALKLSFECIALFIDNTHIKRRCETSRSVTFEPIISKRVGH